MKKLSVLIALALCLTIGGAYAAWSFAVGQVTNDTHTFNPAVSMVVDSAAGSKGILSAEFNVAPGYTVDPTDAEKGNYIPKLYNNITDTLDITFVADANAEESVKTSGVTVHVIVTATGFGEYNEKTVITADATPIAITVWANKTVNDDGTVTFTYSIDSATLFAKLSRYDGVALDTVAKAEAFKAEVAKGTITITVTANIGG